jgi:hypothetical protein
LEHSAEVVELNSDGHVLSTPPDVNDKESWYRANPALGDRIEEEFLTEQLEILGPDLFAREHLCVWDPYPNAEGGFLPYEDWLKLVAESTDGMTSVCYGLSVVGDRASVASAGRLPSGHLYVDTAVSKSGTDWIVTELVEKGKPIRVDPAAQEGAFIRPLEEAGVKVDQVSDRAYQNACGEILDTMKNGTIRHLGQSELNRAVRSVQRRDVGKKGAWVWADSPVDITTLKAATLALTGVTAKRRPRIHTLEGE